MRSARDPKNLFDLAEKLEGAASGDTAQAWILGVGAAVVVAGYGFYCLATQSAKFIGGRPLRIVELRDSRAVALGIVALAVACFMHSHFFWSAHEKCYGYAQLGKLVSLIAIVAGIGYLVLGALIWG